MSHISCILDALHKVKHDNVPLKDIPAKYRSPSVVTAALKKDPHALDFVAEEAKIGLSAFLTKAFQARRAAKANAERAVS